MLILWQKQRKKYEEYVTINYLQYTKCKARVEKCDGKTAHRWGIWLLSERERSSDPHH